MEVKKVAIFLNRYRQRIKVYACCDCPYLRTVEDNYYCIPDQEVGAAVIGESMSGSFNFHSIDTVISIPLGNKMSDLAGINDKCLVVQMNKMKIQGEKEAIEMMKKNNSSCGSVVKEEK